MDIAASQSGALKRNTMHTCTTVCPTIYHLISEHFDYIPF